MKQKEFGKVKYGVVLMNSKGRVNGMNTNLYNTEKEAKKAKRRLETHKFEDSVYVVAQVLY